jgi:sterol desaturase/sphingolipid hydroxylase (fatty acid hydroxylase superfamily)
MLATLRIAAANFALLALVFIPLERLFRAREQRILRREVGTDALFFAGQYVVFGGVALALLGFVQSRVHAGTPAEWRVVLARLPAAPLAVVAVVLGDVLVYWFHRACHRFDGLWRFHAVHHSSEELDWLAAHREHPLDGLFTQLLQNLPAILLGVHYELLAGLVVFRGAWAIFIHSNVTLSPGPLRYLLGAPELHHFHHAKTRETRHNFANLAPYLDVVFGTYHAPSARSGYELGLGERLPSGYFRQLLAPFSAKAARARACAAEPATLRGMPAPPARAALRP